MSEEQALQRPIGWWLKEADSRLDAAFDAALAGHGIDRRGWQVLATLAKSSTPRPEVITALVPFDQAATVEAVIDDLHRRGWIDEADGLLGLTPEGTDSHETLVPLVADVRRQVTAALSQDEYVTLVQLLARLVAAFPEPSR